MFALRCGMREACLELFEKKGYAYLISSEFFNRTLDESTRGWKGLDTSLKKKRKKKLLFIAYEASFLDSMDSTRFNSRPQTIY